MNVVPHACMWLRLFSACGNQSACPGRFGMLQMFFLWMWYSVQMLRLSVFSGLGGLIWCFCFPESRWRERASSSPSRGERSRPSVSRRGSRCGPWTLKGPYWACSRPPAWPPNRKWKRRWGLMRADDISNVCPACKMYTPALSKYNNYVF